MCRGRAIGLLLAVLAAAVVITSSFNCAEAYPSYYIADFAALGCGSIPNGGPNAVHRSIQPDP